MNTKKMNSQRGVSIIEVLVILAVTAIIIGIAVSRFGNAKDNFRRQNIARELKVNLERARFDSVKRRADESDETKLSRVVIESATAFSVYFDMNQDGSIDVVNERKRVDFSSANGVKIVGNNLVFPITIKFDRRGHITVDGIGNNVTPSFTVCDAGCTFQTASVSNSNVISVSQTGTVSMTGGGEAVPTFSNPTIDTSVNPCDAVNTWVTVADPSVPPPNCSSTPTPTPGTSPSPSPSTSPSPSPTASPSSSPSASASPSASPTPRACNTDERPTGSNPPSCVCVLPKTIRSNGKCI